MKHNEKFLTASAVAQCAAQSIVFGCMSVGREMDMPEWKARLRLGEAREAAERVLVAILAAEQSIAPRATPAQANDALTYDQVIDAVAGEMGASA